MLSSTLLIFHSFTSSREFDSTLCAAAAAANSRSKTTMHFFAFEPRIAIPEMQPCKSDGEKHSSASSTITRGRRKGARNGVIPYSISGSIATPTVALSNGASS